MVAVVTARRPVFPLEPLRRLLHAESTKDLAEATGVARRQVNRWNTAGGMGERHADQVAVHLGLHPSLIWPDEWAALAARYERTP